MRSRRFSAALLVPLLALGAACGGGGGDDDAALEDELADPTGTSVPGTTAASGGGTQVLVFIDPTADIDAIDAIGDALVADERADSVVLVDQQAAYDEFQCLFADSPALTGSVTVQQMPASYRVGVTDPDLAAEVALGAQDLPGVQEASVGSDVLSPGTLPSMELEVGSDCTAEGVTLK